MYVQSSIDYFSSGDTRESLGRVVNAFMGALEYIESDGEVQIIFDGGGTQAAAEFDKPDHKYHELFEKVRKRMTGVCSYCAGALKVKDKIEAANLPFSDQFKGHPSCKQLIEQGFDVLTF
jgi:hypothetical protein